MVKLDLLVVLMSLVRAPTRGDNERENAAGGRDGRGRLEGNYPGVSCQAFACSSSPFGQQQLKQSKQKRFM